MTGQDVPSADALPSFSIILPTYNRSEVVDQIAEGDKVVTRIVSTGTHTGAFQGIPATGKPIRVDGILIERYANGRIVERWDQFDQLGMLQQLGVIPVPQS